VNRQPLSVVVTTLDSADTLPACLASVAWAEDIVVLDSGSTDATRRIAEAHGARFLTRPFTGYSEQKQAAIDLARHDWVLLLDSDEKLAEGGEDALRAVLADPDRWGYVLWRREWLFWRWQSPRSRLNHYVRLFDRRHARMNGLKVHETVAVDGPVRQLDVMIDHYGERDITGRTHKANRYSSLQVEDLERRGVGQLKLRLVCYPWIAFVRYYFLRGHWREGWAGFVAARVHAFYAFLKYAKLYEVRRGRVAVDRDPGPGTRDP